MTAFKQVLKNLQAGQREEALIGLEFVLRLDPRFAPATSLQRQLAAKADEIDLGDIIAQLQAPTTEAINGLLIEAVDDFNSREFISAKEKVEKVLIDLPGHQEARELRDQIDKALKIESQVGQFLIQAREALAGGDPQEAANFVMMAQALDPHHTGIASTLKEIDQTGGLAFSQEAAAAQPEPFSPASEEAPEGLFSDSAPIPEPPVEEAQAEPALSDDVDQNAFAVEFDTSDPFADLIEPASQEEGGPTAAAFTAEDVDTFQPMDDTADLFAAPGASAAGDDPSLGGAAPRDFGVETTAFDHADESSVAERISTLIDEGQAAYDRNDEPLAISLWSRIFLIKPTHPEAGHLIVKAKKRLADSETEVEALLGRARDAFDEGEYEAASLFVSTGLGIRPNHLGIVMLKEELEREMGSQVAEPETGADEAPGPSVASSGPEMPDLDDDLFGDLGDEAAPGTTVDDDLFTTEVGGEEPAAFEQLSPLERAKSKLPIRILAVSAVALVVVLAGVWMGSRFLAPAEPEVDDAAAVTEVLMQAERLFKEHRTEEALHLLREFPASGLSQQRIEMRIAKYEESLAPPTPTPVPEQASQAQELLDRGLWWAAYTAAGDGLKLHPDDGGLEKIRESVLEIEPEAAALDSALRLGDYRAAVSIAEELLIQYPRQSDIRVVLERCLFNAALAESRAYNLTGAENHLLRLLELEPEDEEAERFLEFVQKYKVRAADMRLEIFIRSMNER